VLQGVQAATHVMVTLRLPVLSSVLTAVVD